MSLSNLYRSALLSLSLASGCVTYSEDIKIWDTEGNVYRKPRKESSWEMQRNEPETIAIIPRGRKGKLRFEWVDGEGRMRKGWFQINPAESYRILRTTRGELYFYEQEQREAER